VIALFTPRLVILEIDQDEWHNNKLASKSVLKSEKNERNTDLRVVREGQCGRPSLDRFIMPTSLILLPASLPGKEKRIET